ncbi:MAG TPA: hypothetical protein VGH50_17320, partial [Candidatus Binatia bacterium]
MRKQARGLRQQAIRVKRSLFRHPRESGGPGIKNSGYRNWIPAFAGMTLLFLPLLLSFTARHIDAAELPTIEIG